MQLSNIATPVVVYGSIKSVIDFCVLYKLELLAIQAKIHVNILLVNLYGDV